MTQISLLSSEEAMTKLVKNENEFQKFVDGPMTYDVIVVTLRVLANICKANFNNTMMQVLNMACCDNFLKKLVNFLATLLTESSTDKLENQLYHEDIQRFVL